MLPIENIVSQTNRLVSVGRYSGFLTRSKPRTLFEDLKYESPTSGSALLRLDKLQGFTVTTLSNYIVHLNDFCSEGGQDATVQLSDELSVARSLQSALDPASLAEREGKSVSKDHLREAGRNLLNLNAQANGGAGRFVQWLRTLLGPRHGTNTAEGSQEDVTCIELL
jgi:hypothetical protein